MESRKITHSVSDTTYLGAVICSKHPELEGLRRKANTECVGCRRMKAKYRKQRPENRAKANEKRKFLSDADRAVTAILYKREQQQRRIAEDLAREAGFTQVMDWANGHAEKFMEEAKGKLPEFTDEQKMIITWSSHKHALLPNAE